MSLLIPQTLTWDFYTIKIDKNQIEIREREREKIIMSFVESSFCGGFIFVVDASTSLLLFVLLHSTVCNQQFSPSHYKELWNCDIFPNS